MKEADSTFKALMSTLCLFFVVGVLTLNFQNCSGLSASDYGSNDDTVSQGESGLIPIGDNTENVDTGFGDISSPIESEALTAVFADGENFIGNTLVSSGSFLDTLIKVVGYEQYSKGKAIAVARNGMGYAALTDSDNMEAERMALESCNLLAGRACVVIVSGNLFVVDSINAFDSEDYVIDGYDGGAFDRSAMPMSSAKVRGSAVVNNFINAPGAKALALSPAGGAYAVYTTRNSLTMAEVRRMAVQRCELDAAITPCILYAENETVVFDPSQWRKISPINYSNNNIMAESPPASRDGALDAIKSLMDKVEREKYAVYITPNGYGYFGDDATDVDTAKAEARAACESGVHGSRCIEYASSRGVSLSPDHTIAKRDFPALFCKSVRYSCSAHMSVGCSVGAQYWVQNPSTLEAELTSCGN